MANNGRERLYELLPAVYRERDAEAGEALRALLQIVEEQSDHLQQDIQRLWDNFFVELCEPWVIPYIGDLVGTTPLFDESRVEQPDTADKLFEDLNGSRLLPDVAIRSRADVAKTIYYRRRKGTLPMLEELARDVTGWGAHAVEFFELLGWTQCVRNHLRSHSVRCADIRQVERADRADGAFDEYSHIADVRPISALDGWHNINNIGLFLWRVGAYEAEGADARRLGAAGDFRYHVSPLGHKAALFSRWRAEGDETGLSTEFHVPGPIRPAAFFDDLKSHQGLSVAAPYTQFYGLFDLIAGSALPQAPASSVMVVLHSSGSPPDPVPPDRVRCMNLSAWARPSGDRIGIDVTLGRLTLGPALSPDRVEVFFHYGFPANLGGGPYQRRAWRVDRTLASHVLRVAKSGTGGSHTTLNAALADWVSRGRPDTIISIEDNRTYAEAISIELSDDRWLAIEAADGVRPHLQLVGQLTVTGDHPGATLTLSGLLVEGTVDLQGSIERLRILHSTLVPGASIAETDPPSPPPSGAVEASVTAASGASGALLNQALRLEIAFSIMGPLRIPRHAKGIWALDSIIDGVNADAIASPSGSAGPALWLERVSILGRTLAREMTMASEVVFDSPVIAERQQTGCIRFSYVPEGSVTPRRHRCQPDLRISAETASAEEAAIAAGDTFDDTDRAAIADRVNGWLTPAYTSTAYGQPGYMQLHLACPVEIIKGAEDGSEMGAYCHLKQPQRAANLRQRLDEYLPFGLEAGLVYVT